MGSDIAPGPLAAVQQLANSYDVRRGRDDLADARRATGWLRAMGLLGGRTILSDEAVPRLHALRETVRNLLLANNGAQTQATDLDALNALLEDCTVRPTFTVDGPALSVAGEGAFQALGRLVAIIYDAMQEGTWSRLKACPEDACNYAFYDTSRNASRVWCSMAGCGSRVKMRAYRARKATG